MFTPIVNKITNKKEKKISSKKIIKKIPLDLSFISSNFFQIEFSRSNSYDRSMRLTTDAALETVEDDQEPHLITTTTATYEDNR
jgi:hypothetical protein